MRAGLLAARSRLDVRDHIRRMGRDIGHLVRPMDPPVGIDEVAVPLRVLGILLVRTASNLVLGSDRSVDVAEQAEREVLRFGEGEVLAGRVERRPEDDGVELCKALGTVTQALSLDRSTRCRGFGKPPQQDPLTAKVAQPYDVAVVIR